MPWTELLEAHEHGGHLRFHEAEVRGPHVALAGRAQIEHSREEGERVVLRRGVYVRQLARAVAVVRFST